MFLLAYPRGKSVDEKGCAHCDYENLAEIVGKLQTLMDSFWIYIVMALAGVVVVWGAFVGIKIAIAHKNEEKINARDMVKNLIIGIIIIFVVAMGAPLLINGLSAWVTA